MYAAFIVQELLAQEKADKVQKKYANVDVEELLDDPDLEQLHEQRLAELKAEREKRQEMSHKGHGEVTDITEGEFLEVVTKTDFVACHFFHKDFERCKIMDKHLRLLAPQYFSTRFCKLHAPDAPFFVAKLQVQMLPCLVLFVNGVAVDRVVGFEELGKRDDFNTQDLEKRMIAAGVLQTRDAQRQEEEDDDERGRVVRRGVADMARKVASSDEDSDF
jgi:thioredoxin-like negative regulator of GroEL